MIDTAALDAGFAGKVVTVIAAGLLLAALLTGKLNVPKWASDDIGDDEDEIIDESEAGPLPQRTTE